MYSTFSPLVAVYHHFANAPDCMPVCAALKRQNVPFTVSRRAMTLPLTSSSGSIVVADSLKTEAVRVRLLRPSTPGALLHCDPLQALQAFPRHGSRIAKSQAPKSGLGDAL